MSLSGIINNNSLSQTSNTVVITEDTTTNATMYPTWVTANSGNLPIKVSSTKFSFNPSSGIIFPNNYLANSVSIVSGGTTTTLTVASARFQTLTGSSSQTFQLPDATTVPRTGHLFSFNNNSSGSLIITNNGGSTLYTVPAGGYTTCNLLDNSSANGIWDFHPYPPSTVTWGSGVTGLVFNTALNTTPSINAGASSSTSPSFIPQRGSSTTGYGGDSTHLYGIIGGSAVFTASSSDFALPTGVTIGNATPVTIRGHRPQVTISGTSRTLALSDADTFQITTNGSATTVTIDTNANVAFAVNTEIDFFQQGAGQLIFAAAGGVTIQSLSSQLKLVGQYAGATIKKLATDTWSLVGNLTA